MSADEHKWVRLFNRLDAAITRHKEEMDDSPLTPADESLYAAHAKVLRDAAKKPARPNGAQQSTQGENEP